MKKIKTIGIIGTGLIGSGWAARAIHYGVNVIGFDKNTSQESSFKESVNRALPYLKKLTSDLKMPKKGKLCFTTNLNELINLSDIYQENVPENLKLKSRILSEIDLNSDPKKIICSSTSGFMPSKLQKNFKNPERFLVAHPFNPVYLCPLVEIVPGKKTSNHFKKLAKNFYENIGMHVLLVRKEIPGHISDRLQESMWREVLYLLKDNVANTKEIDESITHGPGLRWSIMGINQLWFLAGGKGGTKHFINQFGPALKWPWSHMKAPNLNKKIVERFSRGTKKQTNGKSINEIEKIRDDCLVAILKVLKKHNFASGNTLNIFEKNLKKINK
ncbi:MAG: L-carnitine dehydrogenase [Alphaproteobacteria bacterium MarineAlpha5_Bin9]|nr:MAG: L-carnitine dehydrogenase [Alphaproteobacteria bacterium MarineAlpha5_Bin9]|tara:strand:- start:2518 stop:3507 length:990 start_codon:yes stop_codon:yes gene_type:complete